MLIFKWSCSADDNDLPQDDLDDAGALDLDYADTEFKMPQSLKKELRDSEGEDGDVTDDQVGSFYNTSGHCEKLFLLFFNPPRAFRLFLSVRQCFHLSIQNLLLGAFVSIELVLSLLLSKQKVLGLC